MVDLNEVAIFVKVVESGSFIGATNALGIPRSTVSRKVADLEARLGVRLLHRTTRTVRPTEAGDLYYQRVSALVSEVGDADLAIQTSQTSPRGRLRVTSPVIFGQFFLGPILAEYLLRYPEVQAEVVATDRLVDVIGEGFDLAIRAGKLEDSTLVARRLASAATFLVASPDYLARRGTPQRIEDLRGHECIGFTGGPGLWQFATDAWIQSIAVQGRLVVNDVQLAHRAALEGLGLARIPAFVCAEDVRSGRLVPVLRELERATSPLHAVYPSNRHLSAKVRAFLDILVQGVARIPL